MSVRSISVLMFSMMLSPLVSEFRASAQELTKQAKIERIMTLTKVDNMTDQIFNQIKTMAISQMPRAVIPEEREIVQQVQDRIFDLVKGVVAGMRPKLVKIYDDNYSDEEISGMLSFYESPTGRAVIEKMPVVMSQSMAAAQAEMKNLAPEIQRIIKEVRPH